MTTLRRTDDKAISMTFTIHITSSTTIASLESDLQINEQFEWLDTEYTWNPSKSLLINNLKGMILNVSWTEAGYYIFGVS